MGAVGIRYRYLFQRTNHIYIEVIEIFGLVSLASIFRWRD